MWSSVFEKMLLLLLPVRDEVAAARLLDGKSVES